MNAGSSQDIGTELHGFIIPITEPPTVEIDTEATAAYIRLKDTKITRTEPYAAGQGLVMLDFDLVGEVVGIEVVGQQEFSIRELIKLIPVRTNESILDRTRYVSANLQAA